ncbi:MAG: hypothetical protein AAFY57_17650 [Cyanobacteria bacterium J06642_2]
MRRSTLRFTILDSHRWPTNALASESCLSGGSQTEQRVTDLSADRLYLGFPEDPKSTPYSGRQRRPREAALT